MLKTYTHRNRNAFPSKLKEIWTYRQFSFVLVPKWRKYELTFNFPFVLVPKWRKYEPTNNFPFVLVPKWNTIFLIQNQLDDISLVLVGYGHPFLWAYPTSLIRRANLNPFLPTVAFSQPSSNICCPRDWRLSA